MVKNFPRFLRPVALAGALALPLHAVADDAGAPASPGPTFGDETQAWVSLQLNPAATDPKPSTLPGDVSSLVYKRWAQSFTHPIPEYFKQQQFVQNGGGSGSGGGGDAGGGGGGGGGGGYGQ